MKNIIIISVIIILCYPIYNLHKTNQHLSYQNNQLQKQLNYQKLINKDTNYIYDFVLEHYKRKLDVAVTVTAYTARKEECDETPWVTAIMQKPVPGKTIAVSRDLKYMLGKQVYIKGFGVREVNDLMNSRYTKRIDILVPTIAEAKKIGRQQTKIVVLN